MKTKGTGGYVEFLWLQNVLFIISVMLVIFVFKADLKVAHTLCSEPPGLSPYSFSLLPFHALSLCLRASCA